MGNDITLPLKVIQSGGGLGINLPKHITTLHSIQLGDYITITLGTIIKKEIYQEQQEQQQEERPKKGIEIPKKEELKEKLPEL